MIDFVQFNLFVNIAIFAVAAVAVWFAGARLSGYANAISVKTGLGQAVIGLLLLGGVTSLPEIGATITSAATGATALAISNLLGSIAAQVTILAVVDLFIVRKALTAVVPDPTVLLQGALNVLLLTIVVAATVTGDVAIIGVGIWAWVCILAYIGSVYLLSQGKGRMPWLAARAHKPDDALVAQFERAQEKANKEHADRSLRALIWWTVGLGLIILVAGYLLSRTGDAIAEQTGLGGGAVGFVLLAGATSLPEFSTTISAARAGLYTMAISDILGTNLINVGLIFVVDAVGSGEPVLNSAGAFEQFGALLGIAVTALFMIGLAERNDKTVFRMGIDSAAVLVCYLAGISIMFHLR